MITLALHNTRALLIDKPRKRWGIVGMPYDFNNLSHFILRKQDLHPKGQRQMYKSKNFSPNGKAELSVDSCPIGWVEENRHGPSGVLGRGKKTLIAAFTVTVGHLTLFDPANIEPTPFRTLICELLEGVTCSKMGLKLSSPKILQIMTQFRYFSHEI